MQFEDLELHLEIDCKRVRVCVKADLLHLFWGASGGPQTAEDIVLSNMEVIRALAVEKASASAVRPIEVHAADYEQEVDGRTAFNRGNA